MSLLRVLWKAVEDGEFKSGLTLADFEVTITSLTKASPPVEALVVDAAAAAYELTNAVGTYGYDYESADFVKYSYIADVAYIGSATIDVQLWTEEYTYGSDVAATFPTGLTALIRNNLQEALADVFTDAEIAIASSDALIIFSRKRPCEDAATLATVASSRLVVATSLAASLLWGYDEMSFHSLYGVEYKTAQWPRKYRNFSLDSDGNIEMKLDSAPSASAENVYVRYYKAHTETTLPAAYIELVVKLATALVLKYKPLKFINAWNAETTKFDNLTTAIGNMSARIQQAIDDLGDGRDKIGEYRASAATAIGNVAARITQAVADLTSGRAMIGDRRAEAITAITSDTVGMTAQINLAITALTSGLALIGDERTTAVDIINSTTLIIEQARDDINIAEGYYNKANISQPEVEYLNSASQELQSVSAKLSQANSLLGAESTSQSYREQAIAQLQTANSLLGKARGLMSMEETPGSYRAQAASEFNSANSYLSQAMAYMSMDATAEAHRSQAASELYNANAYIAQARGYADHIRIRMANVNIADKYEAMGLRMEASLQKELNACAIRRGFKEWPGS